MNLEYNLEGSLRGGLNEYPANGAGARSRRAATWLQVLRPFAGGFVRQMMTIENVHWFLDLFDELAITVWLDGGWGVDALLHEQTRPHQDLDIIIPTADSTRLVGALLERGFTDVETDDRNQRNFVMGHAADGLIDFHVISLTEDGGGTYGPGETDWVISSSELGGEGSIGGRRVRCLSAEYQVRSHSGYALHETDFADMDALRRRFGLELLPEQIPGSQAKDRHG